MLTAFIVVALSLVLLAWSAERFIDGSVSTARHLGMSPLLIGMVIVGFGTSAPELVVSVLAALEGNSGIALGNVYGSNICNIALILGLSALIRPITVNSKIIRKELPILTLTTALAIWQLWDGEISRLDALILLIIFAALMIGAFWESRKKNVDELNLDIAEELNTHLMPIGKALLWVFVGLLLLVSSSRLLIWGAVEIARSFAVNDLIIGLTIVAVGTSLPELASSTIAVRKGQHDIALGNILGSTLFNTLMVTGVAGLIQPLTVAPELLSRDAVMMAALTVSLFIVGHGFRGPARINRVSGALLLGSFIAYTAYLISTVS
jgi:cation:H+ antiporter